MLIEGVVGMMARSGGRGVQKCKAGKDMRIVCGKLCVLEYSAHQISANTLPCNYGNGPHQNFGPVWHAVFTNNMFCRLDLDQI